MTLTVFIIVDVIGLLLFIVFLLFKIDGMDREITAHVLEKSELRNQIRTEKVKRLIIEAEAKELVTHVLERFGTK